MPSKTPITDDLAGFLESGTNITVATRDGELQPDGAPGLAATVHDDRVHLTVFLHEMAAQAMLRNLEHHPEIAVLLDRPSTHRACQVKGKFVSSRKARVAERKEIARQFESYRSDLELIGIPKEMTAEYTCWPCVAFKVRVVQLYEQTPGPGAGEPLK